MRRPIGIILTLVGVLCALWFAVVGRSFTGVYLLGYVGTKGKEAGHELAFMASATVVGFCIGCLIAKLGMRLNRPSRAGT